MGVQQFLKTAFKQSLPTMDAEEIIIGGDKVMAVLDETSGHNELGTAATNNMRTLVAQFPGDAFTKPLKSGMIVQARGEKWQISSDENAIKRGSVATTIVLNEPERRNE